MTTATISQPATAAEVVCVDLDGTLLRVDTLWEAMWQFVRQHPLRMGWLLMWGLRGAAYLKSQLAQHVRLDCEQLPLSSECLAYLNAKKKAGAALWLVTGSHQTWAEQLAQHLGIFDRVLATTSACNLTGARKAELLEKLLGAHRFTYVGNSYTDIPVWRSSLAGVVVRPDMGLLSRLQRLRIAADYLPGEVASTMHLVAGLLRLRQWSKNTLIVVPMMMAKAFSLAYVVTLLLGFVCLGMCASATYILNDLVDIEDDRRHVNKKHRPIASGAIGVGKAMVVAVGLWFAGLGVAAWMNMPVLMGWLLLYSVLTITYSLQLKSMVILDVVALCGLYLLRLCMGAALVNVPLSHWFLLFSMLFFMSLALAKRYVELRRMESAQIGLMKRRNYIHQDKLFIGQLGTTALMGAMLVFGLYLSDELSLRNYRNPHYLWAMLPILFYWLARVWLICFRGSMHDHPIDFVFMDRQSQGLALVLLGVFLMASFG